MKRKKIIFKLKISFRLIFILLLFCLTSCVKPTSQNQTESQSQKDLTASGKEVQKSPKKVNADPLVDSTQHKHYERAFSESDTSLYFINGELVYAGIMEGKFLSIDVGDFMHLSILDSLEKVHSFWIGAEVPMEIIDRLAEEQKEYKFQEIQIKWERRKGEIPYNDGPLVMYTLVDIKFLD